MTNYEKLQNRINEILGDNEFLSIDRIFIALNKYLALKDRPTPLLSPFGNIYFLKEKKFWEDKYDMGEEIVTLIDKKPKNQTDDEGMPIEPELYCEGTIINSGLKIDPTKPLDDQDELGNATFEALYNILN